MKKAKMKTENLTEIQKIKLAAEAEKFKLLKTKREKLEGNLFDKSEIDRILIKILLDSKKYFCPRCREVISKIIKNATSENV